MGWRISWAKDWAIGEISTTLHCLGGNFTMLHTHYLSSLCQRRHWPEPRYVVTRSGSAGYRCVVRVNNREYQTPRIQTSESTAKEEAALIAFNICRSFSANDGMYPTGFAHDGVIQGNPVPVGSGRHNRDSNSSLDQPNYHYTSDSAGSRSGGSSPDYSARHRVLPASKSSRHSSTDSSSYRPARSTYHYSPGYGRHQYSRHY